MKNFLWAWLYGFISVWVFIAGLRYVHHPQWFISDFTDVQFYSFMIPMTLLMSIVFRFPFVLIWRDKNNEDDTTT
jgi:hypothetical protein